MFYCFGLYAQSNRVEEALRFYNERNYEASIGILEPMERDNPYKLESSLLLADNYIKIDNYLMAERIIKDLQRYHPKNYQVLERKLLIELLDNKNAEARATIFAIKSLDSKNYFASYAEGLLSERNGYLKSAMSFYEKARVIDKNRYEATVALAYLKLALGDKNGALNLFKENIAANPRDAESYYNIANYYYITKNYNQALNEINNAFYYYPNYTSARILEANILMALKRYDESIRVFESMPDNVFADGGKFYYIGSVYENANNYVRAKGSYINYLRTKPDNELGRLAYERVLLHTNPNPDYERDRAALYYGNMASYYARLADNIRAQAYFKHMLKLNPANSFARVALSDLYRSMGFIEKSLEELSIARDINKSDKSISYRYDSYKRTADRTIPSKAWGINQYNLKPPGYLVAITDTLILQKDSPKFLNTAMYQTFSYVLPEYSKFRVLDMYTNNVSTDNLYNTLVSKSVDFYMRGSIFESLDTLTLLMSLIDVRSGKSVTNFSLITRGKEKMMNAAVMVGRYISNSIPFYANIVEVYNDNIYINAGKVHGVTNDMNFAVYNFSKAYYDINTKSINASGAEVIGMIKIVTADENVSLGKLVDSRALNYIKVNQVVVPFTVNTAKN